MNTDTEEKKEKKEEIKLSPRELENIENTRMANGIKKECAREIDIILKKYNARMMVNPLSTLRNLEIIVVLN